MQKAQESERSILRAKVSWEQSKDDLEMAKSMIKTHPDTSCLLSSQAAINAFSSILQAHGHFQLPAYSSTEMLNQCSSVSPAVERLDHSVLCLTVPLIGICLDTPVQKIYSSLRHLPELLLRQAEKYIKLSEHTGMKTGNVFLIHDW